MAQEIKKAERGAIPTQRDMDPFAAMRTEIDRVFDAFLGRGAARLLAPVGFQDSDVLSPSIDIRETETEFVIEAELPGIDEKDVSITLNDDVLTVKGEKRSEREDKKSDDYHLMERSYGSFQRSFRVSDAVDAEKVKATFEKGVLKVMLPKRPGAVKAEKRIPIGKG